MKNEAKITSFLVSLVELRNLNMKNERKITRFECEIQNIKSISNMK